MKKVLVLGAGRIARPCIQYLLDQNGYEVYVADICAENIERCIAGKSNGFPVVGNVMDRLPQIIDETKPDIMICLLPPACMVPAARAAIDAGIHYVNPSYVKKEMSELNEKAVEKGVTLLCELGLDPGIDHMSATKTICDIHSDGGKIVSFKSLCGALPAPKDNNNPLGYKLSWAPGSLIGASMREARIIKDGETIVWPDGETYHHSALVDIQDMGWFEEYANADSTPYVLYYGMPEVKNVYRGTLRYVGWCEMICKMQQLGLCSDKEEDFSGMTYADVIKKLSGAAKCESAKEAARRFLSLEAESTVLHKFEWLGLFDEKPVPISKGSMNKLIECVYEDKLIFAPGESDLSLMEHILEIEYPDRKVLKRSTLIDYGCSDGDFSIAKLTGLPPAMGTKLILDGKITKKGVLRPTMPEVYEPELAELEKLGIVFKDTDVIISHS